MALGENCTNEITVEIAFPGRHSSSATKLPTQVTSCMNIKCVEKVSTIHHPLLYLRKLTEGKKKHEISHVENSLQEVPGQQILENSYMEKKTHECNECGKTFLNIAHLIVVFKIKTMRSWRDGGKGKLFITQIEDMNSVG